MARVVPVGPIDPELYAFAKKEAEKAERNPRYVPKNCPADRGQIIYKRIGATVKALVTTSSYICNFAAQNRMSFPPTPDMYKDMAEDFPLDTSGDYGDPNFQYPDYVITSLRNDGFGFVMEIERIESTWIGDVNTLLQNYGIAFYEPHIEDDGGVVVGRMFEYHARGIMQTSPESIPQHDWILSVGAGIKEDVCILVLHRAGIFDGEQNIASKVELIVNGDAVVVDSAFDYDGWLDASKSIFVRSDGGGCAYLSRGIATYHLSDGYSAAYHAKYSVVYTISGATIANKYGIFMARGKHVLWMQIEKSAENTVHLGVTVANNVKFYELRPLDADDAPYFSGKTFICTFTKTPNSVLLCEKIEGRYDQDGAGPIYDPGRYIDLTEIIEKVWSGQASREDLNEWRTKRTMSIGRVARPDWLIPDERMSNPERSIVKKAYQST